DGRARSKNQGEPRWRRSRPRCKERCPHVVRLAAKDGCSPADSRLGNLCPVTGLQPESWAYAEHYLTEDEVLLKARNRAAEVGAVPVGPGAGAMLRFLAAVLQAKTVVEIGTGCGVSGVWLLRGMRPDGTLTSVDLEAEHQRLARETFADAGIS